ncbi:hypothetical protein ABS768_01160 [Flavobacterium sp. ST-75]|uniref:Lipoprotein n=1 Tax=Flavobacterium rhizophilum TaxID=3163296 RepID=A0ABW8Y9T3_9FLAO
MKKLSALFAIVILVFACDDGDMTFKDFNFGDVTTAQLCTANEFLYKVNGTEVLILDVNINEYFSNIDGAIDTITVNSANKVIYRNYSGTVTSSSICTSLPPATPTVVEEWNASQGGELTVTTTKLVSDDGDVSFEHSISIVRLEFVKDDETIVIENQNYGTYTTSQGFDFEFLEYSNGDPINPTQCVNGDESAPKLLYEINSDEVLKMVLTSTNFNTLFVDEVTGIDAPRILELDETDNRVIFDVYSSTVSGTLICSNTPPITPVVEQRWIATGEIWVITEEVVVGEFQHTVIFHDVTFFNSTNDEETFKPTEDENGNYIFGQFGTE